MGATEQPFWYKLIKVPISLALSFNKQLSFEKQHKSLEIILIITYIANDRK